MSKLPFVAFLVLAVLVQVALAAISLDDSDGATNGSDTDPHNLSFTVASNSDRVLLTMYGTDNSAVAGSMTFNGDAMTNVPGADINAGGNNASAGIYYRIGPDVATGNVVLNLGSNGRAGVFAISLFGAHQSSPITDSDETTGTTETQGLLTLTTVVGDYVVYCVSVRDDAAGMAGTIDNGAGADPGDTQIADLEIPANIQHVSCSYLVATDTSTEVGYSWNVATEWAMVAVAVTPSGGAPPAATTSLRRRRQ